MPRRSTWCLWLAVVPLCAGLAGCRSTGTGSSASLAGTVTDFVTAQPVVGAEVDLGHGSAPTDQQGRFAFDTVEVGTRQISVSASGYDPLTQSVEIEAGKNTVNLQLHLWGSGDGGTPDGPGQHDAGQQDGPGQHDAGQHDGPGQQDGPCGGGALLCGGTCATCPAGATATQCSGSTCIATACTGGYRLCGSACCAWTIEQVGWISSGASEAALALDSSGQPRIVYADYNGSAIKYAYRAGSAFTTETIASAQGADVCIAVDSYGTPHVGYSQSTNLEYATRATGWSVTTLSASQFTIGLYPSIAVDGTNAVHLAFMGYTSSSPIALYRGYKSYGSSSWRFDSVDNRGTAVAVGYNVSLAVSSTGLAQILYSASQSSVNSVWYAYESGGYFYPSQVDSADFIMGDRGAIALDSYGYPFIAYPAYLGGQSNVIRAGTKSTGSWFLAEADSSTTVQGCASIAVDPAHVAHGIYARGNGSTTEVVYATQTGTTWRAEVVASGELWSNHALVLDSSGNPNLVFVSPYNASTRYVYWAH
jgi:hypothetical protein